MGFLKVCAFFSATHRLTANYDYMPFLRVTIVFIQCIKGSNRLRADVKVFNADKAAVTGGAAFPATSSSPSPPGLTPVSSSVHSDLVFSVLSPLIYHESECDMSSQVKHEIFISNGSCCDAKFYTLIAQVQIMLPFIPPSEAIKLHVLFNVCVHCCH